MGWKMGAGSSTAGAGELQVISIIASSAPGLSPLARGTLTDFIDRPIDLRFIPAGAGNTQIPLSLPSLFPVYPRWRGEHGLCALVGENGGGLSPLARGTHFPDRVLRILSRFIPAGAGNTLSIHICF